MSLLFNMLSSFVITFLPRSIHFIFRAAVNIHSDFGAQENKVSISIVSQSVCHEVMRPDATILVFWMLSFKPVFLLSSFSFIKRLCSSSLLSDIRVVSSAYLSLLIFLLAIWQSDPLEKGMVNHFSILAFRTPWTVWKGKNLFIDIGKHFCLQFN